MNNKNLSVSSRLFGGFLLLFAAHAFAVDGVAISYGNSWDGSNLDGRFLRLALQWDIADRPDASATWQLDRYWEADIAHWEAKGSGLRNGSLNEVGVAPVFRLVHTPLASGARPYVEGAIGIHLLSDHVIGNRDLGSDYHFGTHLGAGVLLKSGLDIGVRVQHLSNAGLKKPNPGVDYAIVRIGYRWH